MGRDRAEALLGGAPRHVDSAEQRGRAGAVPRCGHGRQGGPAVRCRVVGLNFGKHARPDGRVAFPADDVELAIQDGTCDPAPRRGQRGPDRPPAGCRIECIDPARHRAALPEAFFQCTVPLTWEEMETLHYSLVCQEQERLAYLLIQTEC